MGRKIPIIIAMAIFLLTILSFFISHDHSNQLKAKNGILALEEWNFNEREIVTLDGEWLFYPGELITPKTDIDVFKQFREIEQLIAVPGGWELNKSMNHSPYGVGTYRLLINVPKDENYGVKVNTIRHSSKMFINGREVGASGNPSSEPQEYQFDDQMYTAFGDSREKQLEIVIQVANLRNPTGGIVHSINFGEAEDILGKRDLSIIFDTVLVSGYLLLAIIYFVSYIQRKKHIFELFFGIFCFLQAVYLSTLNEKIALLFLPNGSNGIMLNVQLFFINILVLFFLLFIFSFFKPYANKRIVTIICLLLCLQAFIFGPPNPIIKLISHFPLQYIQISFVLVLAISYIYICFILIKAYINKSEESKYVLIVATAFICYGISLGVNLLWEVDSFRVPLLLFIVMVISLSSLISYRNQLAFERIDELSKELLHYDQLKDEFLTKTSHELRTPLHGILNLSKQLMEGLKGPLNKNQQENIILIHSVGKRMTRLVEDLLYAGKIKKEQIEINPVSVNITIVEEVLSELTFLIPDSKEVKLVNNIHPDLPLIYVDVIRLKQILFNLIYNAIKYTEYGEIVVSAAVKNNEMHISVNDTGIGVEKSHQEQIFSAFYQIGNKNDREKEGIGLGLSITKQLIKLSGGEIWVTSEINKGSCFTFTIPVANESQLTSLKAMDRSPEEKFSIQLDKENSAISLELPKKITGARPYTIVAVDDNHINLKILIDIISSFNYTVIAVDNGQDALEIIKKEPVDLLILDLMMPIMSGFDVCRVVRKEYHLAELPILILTASGQLNDLIVSFQNGANDFLQKPIISEEINLRIESLLSIKKAVQESVKNELSYLNAQIAPHFLYNTLNSIIALSYQDEEKTRQALEHLTTYFRAKLDFEKHHRLIPIEEEVELVQAYLAIEKMRFNKRLNIVYDIDETVEVLIPAMTIQPLVENAVQHGITRSVEGGTLQLSINKEAAKIKIVIEDNGVGIPIEKQKELLNERHHRIGFTNALKKLRLMNNKSIFLLESEEGKGTKITIYLPEVKHFKNI